MSEKLEIIKLMAGNHYYDPKVVERNLQGVEFFSAGGCESCNEGGCEWYDPEVGDESYFSWAPCKLCNRQLGGDRYAAHGMIDGELAHFNICTDCLFYVTYGDIPEEQKGYCLQCGESCGYDDKWCGDACRDKWHASIVDEGI